MPVRGKQPGLPDDYWRDEGAVKLRRMAYIDDGIDGGVVFVMHLGMWGGICQDWWSFNDAEVVCSELGYHYTNSHELPVYIIDCKSQFCCIC